MKANTCGFRQVALSATVLITLATAHADLIWQGDTNSDFSEGANWVGGTWDQWSDYTFGAASTNGSVNINGSFGMNSLTFASGLGQDIVIGSTTNEKLYMGINVVGNPSALITIDTASKDLTINAEYQAASAVTWDVGAGRTLTMNGTLNDWFNPAALVKDGTGTAVLAGSNPFSGGTTISDGNLVAQRSTLGTGAVVIHNGGTLHANDQWVLCGANQYGVNERNIGTLTIHAGGTLYLDPTNGFANGATNLILNGGAVTGGNNSDERGALFLWNGNEQITAGGAATSMIAVSVGLTGTNNTITVDGGSSLHMTEVLKNSDWYGPNSFTGGFMKDGAGTLTLSAASTFTGGTTVNSGILELSGSNGGTGRIRGPLTVNAGAEVRLTNDDGTGFGYNEARISSLSINSGSVSSEGSIHIWNLAGGVNLNGGTLSSNGGASTTTGPQLEWGNTTLTSNASADTSTMAGRIHIRRDAASVLRVDVADGAAATDLLISAALTESAAGCNLVKSGAGTLKLSGAVNLTGFITVNAGTLDLSSATLGDGVHVNVQTGAQFIPPTMGLPVSAMIYINGEKLALGTWGSPGSVAAGLAQYESPVLAGSTVMTVPDTGVSNRERWKSLEYGIFSHYNAYVTGVEDVNAAANAFDAVQYADDLEQAGVQYVVWTAWHANMFPMFPSQAAAKYGYGNRCSTRDTVGDMIEAVKAKGIRVYLYTHPYQPLTSDLAHHNHYINELYAELIDRYGSRIDGLWIDENTTDGTQDSLVDYKRLMTTIKEHNPEMVMMQNGGQLYTVEMGGPEIIGSWNFGWSECLYNYAMPGSGPGMDDMLRTLVVQAAANFEGGGVHWNIDGVANGGLAETTRVFALGRYLAPIRPSICETTPSNRFPPPYKNGRTIDYNTVDWVATSSADETKEFIHVLKAPAGSSLTLPGTADGTVFGNATLMASLQTGGGTQQFLGTPMAMIQTPRGIQLTLPSGVSWSSLDTVIQLDVASKGGAGMVNDTSAAITYSGQSWIYQSHRGVGEYNDDIHTATANGDSFTFTFSGTEVEYIASRAASRGPVDIYIDEVLQTTVDLSTGSPLGPRQTVYRKSGLARGQHTLRCVKAGGTYMDADAFKVIDVINDSDAELAGAFRNTMDYGYSAASYSGLWQSGYGGWVTPGTPGDYFEFTFHGAAVDCHLSSAYGSGAFVMYLDGVEQTTVAVGGPTTYSLSGLTNGTHTIKGVTATTNGNGFIAQVNGFKVTRPDIWTSASGRGFGEIGDDVHYTDVNPGTFSFAITGSGVDVITTRDQDSRMAWFGVSGMDRSVGARRNNYSETRQTGTSVFSMPNLTPGSHSISVQHGANTSGLNFSFARLAIDALRVYKGESLSAAPLSWGPSGNGGSGTWDVGSTNNWFDGGLATAWHDFGGNDYSAVFSGIAGTVDLAANINANRITFQSAGFTLQGGSLTLNGTAPILTADGAATISSTLMGSSGLIKAGAGTLSVTGSNNCAGATLITAGTLELNGTYAAASFAIASGAMLDFNAASTLNLSSVTLSGSGTLRKTGSNEIRWAESSAIFALAPGSLIDVQGGIFVGGSNANEDWAGNLSDLHVAAGATFGGVEANVRVDVLTGSGTIRSGYPGAGYSAFTFGVDNGSGTFDGSLANNDTPGNFIKTGTGTQTLAGSNTYSGTTTIDGGKLIVSGSLNNTSFVTIASGAELEISGSLAASGNIVNHGTLILSGAAQLTAAGTITNHGTIINLSPSYTLPANLVNNGTIYSVPAAPTGLVATPDDALVTLTWNAVANATSYTVKQSAFSGGPYATVATTTSTSQQLTGLTNGSSYYFVVSAGNATGEGGNSAQITAVPAGLPSPRVSTDIGPVGLTGSASFSSGTYTIQGAGAGVYASSDAFRYLYQASSGDCSISARVQSLTNPSVSAKTGVMIRESLAANARCVGIYVTPSSGIQFIWRSTTGSMVSISTKKYLTAPYWVRLTRVGNSFSAYYSGNGTTWTKLGTSKTISMSTSSYIGTAVTSGTSSALSTGVITNETTTP